MNEQDWRDNLKAGDEVFISRSYGQPAYADKVSRTTKTQIFVRVNERYELPFRRKDGWLVGGDKWSRQHIIMPSDKLRESAVMEGLISKAKNAIEKIEIKEDADYLRSLIVALTPFQKEVKP